MGHLITLLSSKKPIASDTFNRPDSDVSLGNAETGQAWTAMDGSVWGIGGNAAKIVSGGGRVVINTGVSDNFALQVKFSVIASGTNIQRVVFRYIDSSNEFFIGRSNATQFQLNRRVAGAATNLATVNQTLVDGDIIRVEVRGSRIIAKINGIVVADVTDAANITGTGAGIYAAVDTVVRFDDFIVEAL